MILDTLSGQQTWNGSQAKFNLIWVPFDKKKHIGLRECHLFIAGNQGRGSVTRVKSQRSNALIGLSDDVGAYVESRFEIPDGSILKVSGFIRESDGHGGEGLKRFAQCYIRLREGAALRMVKCDLPNEHGRNRFPYAYVRGHFDILSAQEALAYGVKTPPQFVKTFSKSRFGLVFADMVIEPETTAKTVITASTVATSQGTTEVMMFEKVRKIRDR